MSGPSQHVFEPVRHGEPRLVRLLKSVDARRSDFEAPLRLATALRRRRADFPAQVSLLLQAIEAGVQSSARDRTASPHLELAAIGVPNAPSFSRRIASNRICSNSPSEFFRVMVAPLFLQ